MNLGVTPAGASSPSTRLGRPPAGMTPVHLPGVSPTPCTGRAGGGPGGDRGRGGDEAGLRLGKGLLLRLTLRSLSCGDSDSLCSYSSQISSSFTDTKEWPRSSACSSFTCRDPLGSAPSSRGCFFFSFRAGSYSSLMWRLAAFSFFDSFSFLAALSFFLLGDLPESPSPRGLSGAPADSLLDSCGSRTSSRPGFWK